MDKKKKFIILAGIFLVVSLAFVLAWDLGLNDNLVYYNTFNNTQHIDLISGLNGTAYGANGTVAVGIYNNSVTFNGSQYIGLGNSGGGNPLDLLNNFTFNLWLKPTSDGCSAPDGDGIYGNEAPWTKGWRFSIYRGNFITEYVSGGYNFMNGSRCIANAWQMLTITKNDTDLCFWHNGTLDICSAEAGSIATSDLESYFGCYRSNPGVYAFEGDMDEVGVWNKSLNSSEVSGLYNSGSADTYSSGASIPLAFTTGYPDANQSFRISEFINVSGDNFTLAGEQYRIQGVNFYYAGDYMNNFTYYDDGTLFNNSYNAVYEVLNEMQYLGTNVMRTWFGTFGGNNATTNATWHISQTGGHYNLAVTGYPGNYNESYFASLDKLIYEASQRDIRIEAVLINNWNAYGGMQWFLSHSSTSNKTYENDTYLSDNWWTWHDQFYTDDEANALFQDFINYTLNRNNTYTGTLYKDDPTIFAWFVANEPRAVTDNHSIITQWCNDTINYIKSEDTKHLVTCGVEGLGFNETWGEGHDLLSICNDTTSDFCTIAVNTGQWGYMIERVETSNDGQYMCEVSSSNCHIGNANVRNFWGSPLAYLNYTYNELYHSGVAHWIPTLARHTYKSWARQNAEWANDIGKPIMLQEFVVDQAYADSYKDDVYQKVISTWFMFGGDGVMYWAIADDAYDRTSPTSGTGSQDDGYLFYLSNNATLSARSASTISAFNFTKHNNTGGTSWVTTINARQYDFIVNLVSTPNVDITNCSLYLNISNATDVGNYHVDQSNTSAVTFGNDYTFTRQFDTNDVDFYWFIECAGNDTSSINSTAGYVLLQTATPVVTLISPDNDTIHNTNPISLDYNVTNTLDISYCNLYVNGALNQTDTTIDLNDTQSFSLPVVSGAYSWNISCYDIDSNFGASEERNITIDTINPGITNLVPADNNISGGELINFTSDLSDNLGVANISLYVYNSTNDEYNFTFLEYGTYPTSVPFSQELNLTEDSYTWSMIVRDMAGNQNITSNRSLTIDLTNPQITINSPGNQTYNVQTIEFNVSGNEALSHCLFTFDDYTTNYTMTMFNTSANYTYTSFPENSTNIVKFWCNDSVNNINNTEIQYFYTDYTDPNATNIYPLDNNQTTNITMNFTANVTDNFGVANATIMIFNQSGQLQNETTNTFSDGTTNEETSWLVDLFDGVWTWFIRIFDKSGNSQDTTNRTLTIDSINPQINITYPSNLTYNISIVDFNYTYSDVNSDKCWYSTDGGATNQSDVSSGTNFTINPANGTNTYTLFCNDSLGNENSSSVTFYMDYTPPNASLLSPANGTYNSSTSANFSANLTDNAGLANATLNIVNSSGDYQLLLCYQETANKSNVNDGSCGLDYSGTIYVDGGINGSNAYDEDWTTYTYSSDYYVNYSKPSSVTNITWVLRVAGYSPGVDVNISIPPECFSSNVVQLLVDLGGTGTNTSNIEYCYNSTAWILLRNDTGSVKHWLWEDAVYWETNTSTFSTNPVSQFVSWVVDLADDVYTWWISIWDTAGNNYLTDNRTLTIDSTPPTVNITFPLNQTYNDILVDLNYTYSELYPDSCWYSNDSGVTNYSVQTPGNNFTISPASGENIYLVYCNDSAGNVGFDASNFTYNPVDVQQILPINSNITTLTNIFNCNATGYTNDIDNITIRIYDSSGAEAYVNTNDTSSLGLTDINSTWNVTLGYTDYVWNCEATSNNSVKVNTGNRSLIITEGNLTLTNYGLNDTSIGDIARVGFETIQKANNQIQWCNVTLTDPAGAVIIDNENATYDSFYYFSGNVYNKYYSATSVLLNQTGNYTVNVTCLDRFGTILSVEDNNSVAHNLVLSPQNYSFSAKQNKTELNSFLIYLYDDSNGDINFSISSAIDDPNNFTISTDLASIILNSSDSSSNKFQVNFSLNASSQIAEGLYRGNITFTNSTYGLSYIVNFSYGINPPAGIPEIFEFNTTSSCTNSFTDNCSLKADTLYSGDTTTKKYTINNTGYYQLAGCSPKYSYDLYNASWITFSNNSFDLAIGDSKDITVTFAPVTYGTQEGFFYIDCTSGDIADNPTSSDISNRPYTRIILNQAVSGSPGGGGSAGGGTTTIIVEEGNWTMKTSSGSDSYTIFTERNLSLRFKNVGDTEVNVSLSCEGDYCENVLLSRDGINLPINKDKTSEVTFFVKTPSEIEPGLYSFNIVGVDQNKQQTEVVTVNVNLESGKEIKGLFLDIITGDNNLYGLLPFTIPNALLLIVSFALIWVLLGIILKVAKAPAPVLISLGVALIGSAAIVYFA